MLFKCITAWPEMNTCSMAATGCVIFYWPHILCSPCGCGFLGGRCVSVCVQGALWVSVMLWVQAQPSALSWMSSPLCLLGFGTANLCLWSLQQFFLCHVPVEVTLLICAVHCHLTLLTNSVTLNTVLESVPLLCLCLCVWPACLIQNVLMEMFYRILCVRGSVSKFPPYKCIKWGQDGTILLFSVSTLLQG